MTSTVCSPSEALDLTYSRRRGHVLLEGGATVRLPVRRWRAEADASDRALIVTRCDGPTLDVGCGPGRIVEALGLAGVPALGVDVSARAVELARRRGAPVLRRDVFADLPGRRAWHHVVLVDGNIGIGGDPYRLLHRLADLVHRGGSLLVEIEDSVRGLVRHRVRLRAGDSVSSPFEWARVGPDGIDELAHVCGFRVREVRDHAGRTVAELVRP